MARDDEMPGPADWLGTPEDRREPGPVEVATLEDLARAPAVGASVRARAVKLARMLDEASARTPGVAAIARQHQLTMGEVQPFMAQPAADPVDEIARQRAARLAGTA